MPWAVDTPRWEHAGAALYPNEEIPMGWKAKSAVWAHRLAPDITERFSANVAHQYQMEQSVLAPLSDGIC